MQHQNPPPEVHLHEYVAVIRRRRRSFIAAFATIFLLTAAYAFFSKPVYESTATLHVLEDKGMLKGTPLSDLASVNSFAAQLEIVQSTSNLENVVKRLHLDWKVSDKPEEISFRLLEFSTTAEEASYIVELTGKDTYRVIGEGSVVGEGRSGQLMRGKGIILLLCDLQGKAGDRFKLEILPYEETLDALQKKLKVKELGRKTNIIIIKYRNTDSQRAREVVDTLVRVYLEQAIGFKSEEASRTIGFVEEQLKGMRNELDVNEKNLQVFKTGAGIIDLGIEAQTLIDTVSEKEKQKADIALQKKQVEFALSAMKDSKRRGAVYSPSVMRDDPAMTSLTVKLAELEVQKRGLRAENTETSPIVRGVQVQIDEMQQKIEATYETALHNPVQQEAEVNHQLARYEGKLKDLPAAERDLARLTRLAKVNADIYTFLLQKHEEARIAKASTISNVDIVDPAKVRSKPVAPKKLRLLFLGLFVGSLGGIVIVFFREYLDDTVKDPENAKREIGKPVLAIIPYIPGKKGKTASAHKANLVSLSAPKSVASEAYRSLRTAVHFSATESRRHTIMLASTFPSEGKSTTAANLAVSLSRTGKHVLLVDCDLRRPILHQMFDLSKEPGLTDFLAGDCTAGSVIQDTGIDNLDLVSAGTIPPNPAELLGSSEMRQFIDSMRGEYDSIIIDAPPILSVTDAMVLSSFADTVLLVMEAGRVPVKAARRMRDILETAGTKVTGIVINDKSGIAPTDGFYGGYYAYSDHYGNGTAEPDEKQSLWSHIFRKRGVARKGDK